MPVTEQVMIEFVPDTTGLDSTIETLHKLGQVDQETYDLFKKNNAQYAERVKSMETMNNLQTSLTDKTKQSEKGLDSLVKASKSLSDNLLNEGSLQLFDKLASQLEHNSDAMREFEEGALQGVLEELDRAGVSAEEFLARLQKLDGVTNTTTTAQKSLKAELKEIKLAMAQMKLAGQDNTAAYEELRVRAGEVTDAIGDVNEEIARSGSDTSGLDKLISTSSAVVGGFQAVQGAMALVGDDNEELQQSFVRLQAGMSLLQGLQAIGNELAREDSIIKKGLAIANTLTAATQRALGIATVETSLAFKILRGALIATGIGALVVAVGLLISNWDLIKAKFIEVRDKAMELYDKFALVRFIIWYTLGPLILLYQGLKKVAEVIGLVDDEPTQKLKQGLEDGAAASEALKKSLDGQAELLEAIGGKSQRVLEIRKDSLKAEEDMIRKKLELAVLNEEEEKIAELTNDLHKNKISQLKLEDEIMELQVKKMRDQGKSEKEILEFQKKRIQARIDELEVIIKQLEALKLMEGGGWDAMRDSFVTAGNLQIEALKNKMGVLQQDYEDKMEKSAKKTKEKVEKVKIKLPVELPDNTWKTSFEAWMADLKKRLPDLQINAELVIEQTTKNNNLFTDRSGLEAVLAENNLILQSEKLTASERRKIEQDSLLKKRAFYADQYHALQGSLKLHEITLDEYYTKEAERAKAAAEVEVEIENRKQQRIKELKKAFYQIGQQLADTMINNGKENNRAELDDKLATIAEEQEALEELYKNKQITEVEYQKQKRIIEKQETDAKRAAWQRDRELAMYEVGIKTVQAVITAFASSAPPASYILAAAAGAFGIAQEANLAAKKPPKFAKGTLNAPPGWKWVGEEGPELINTPGGEQIKTHADSVAFANLFNRMDSLADLSSIHVNDKGELVETNPEYRKLISTMESVKESIDNVTIQQTILDRRGYHSAVIEGNSTVYNLSERF